MASNSYLDEECMDFSAQCTCPIMMEQDVGQASFPTCKYCIRNPINDVEIESDDQSEEDYKCPRCGSEPVMGPQGLVRITACRLCLDTCDGEVEMQVIDVCNEQEMFDENDEEGSSENESDEDESDSNSSDDIDDDTEEDEDESDDQDDDDDDDDDDDEYDDYQDDVLTYYVTHNLETEKEE